jgi:CysZ protein
MANIPIGKHMPVVRAFSAIIHGLRFCFFEPAVRSLAVWPWLVGVFASIASLTAAYYAHDPLLRHFISAPDGWWTWILYILAWLLTALLLLLASMILSMSAVFVFAGIFQTAIATAVLSRLQVLPAANEENGVTALLRETRRTVRAELGKLLWILPLTLLLLVAGLIPPLTPFALLLGAWLLAYQFVDTVLDIFQLPAAERLRFAKRNASSLICFGLSLSVLWAVPFVGLLLAPAASAGAAWLVAEPGLLKQIRERQTG